MDRRCIRASIHRARFEVAPSITARSAGHRTPFFLEKKEIQNVAERNVLGMQSGVFFFFIRFQGPKVLSASCARRRAR